MSNPDFTPLDRANVRDFSRELFITAVHRRRGGRDIGGRGEGAGGECQKSGFFPRIKNRVCSREKLVWCPPACSARPTLPFLPPCPSHAHAVSRLFVKFIRRWNGAGPGTHDVTHVGSMFRRCAASPSLFRTVRKHECTLRRHRARTDTVLLHRGCRGYLDIIRGITFFICRDK